MKTELYRVIKTIDTTHLLESDLVELLDLFKTTKNILIRDFLALIFSEKHYNRAVPFILKKIHEKSSFNNNGTLVFALGELNTDKHFISLIKIICEQDYEARLTAYGIVEKMSFSISNSEKKKAIEILKGQLIQSEKFDDDKGENSRLHFIEQTLKLL